MRILVADDDEDIRAQWQKWYEESDCEVIVASDGKEAVKKAKETKPSVCILDLKMPHMDGLEALRRLKKDSPETEVLIITAHADIQSAVTAIQEGAYDYIEKPISFEHAGLILERAVERHRLLEENRCLRLELGEEVACKELIGDSPAMAEVKEKIEQAAGTSANVLIRGESGTGKELVSRLIHYRGARATGPFVAVNIAALSESLLESEMFGHEKNAFTGAITQKKGRFEIADKGTLLLDEVSEIPAHQQVKFLRVIEEREIERVGGTSPVKIDVRIISTTNRDLDKMVKEGEFREDLYYRLNVLSIVLPSLIERREDIPLLAEHYLKLHAAKENKTIDSISPEAAKTLLEFNWPGNVRELMHCIEGAVIAEKGSELSLQSVMAAKIPEDAARLSGGAGFLTLKEMEKEHIKRTLALKGGDKTAAAELLGISRTSVYEKAKQYGL